MDRQTVLAMLAFAGIIVGIATVIGYAKSVEVERSAQCQEAGGVAIRTKYIDHCISKDAVIILGGE